MSRWWEVLEVVIAGISPVFIYCNSWINVLICCYTSVPDLSDRCHHPGGIVIMGQTAGKYSEYPKNLKSLKYQENT